MPLRSSPVAPPRPIIGLLAELHDRMENDFDNSPADYCGELRILIDRLQDLRNECDNCGQYDSNNAEVVRILGHLDD